MDQGVRRFPPNKYTILFLPSNPSKIIENIYLRISLNKPKRQVYYSFSLVKVIHIIFRKEFLCTWLLLSNVWFLPVQTNAQPAYGVHPDQEVSARFAKIIYTSKPIVGRNREERIVRREFYDQKGNLINQLHLDYFTGDTISRITYFESESGVRLVKKFEEDSLISVECGIEDLCEGVYHANKIDMNGRNYWIEITESFDKEGRPLSREAVGQKKKELIQYEYDKKHISQIAWKEIVFKDKEPVQYKEVHRFNEYGDPVEILIKNLTTGDWDAEMFYTNYVYDNQGNWISRMLDAGKRREFMEKREIQYQQEIQELEGSLGDVPKRSIVVLPRIYRPTNENYPTPHTMVIETNQPWNNVAQNRITSCLGSAELRVSYEENDIPNVERLIRKELIPAPEGSDMKPQYVQTKSYSFDGNGNISQEYSNMNVTYDFNLSGTANEINQWTQIDSDGQETFKQQPKYNVCNHGYGYSTDPEYKTFHFYNQYGQPLLEYRLLPQKTLFTLVLFHYNEKGYLTSRKDEYFAYVPEQDQLMNLASETEYSFQNGRPFSLRIKDQLNNDRHRERILKDFEFDQYGNWIKCTKLLQDQDKPIEVVREISYR